MASANRPKGKPERRRASRTALSLTAAMREGNRPNRIVVRVIDIATHGCRIECSAPVAVGSWLWLHIEGLETQHSRVVWHCQEFVGLEFENPLPEAVIDRLLDAQKQLPAKAVNELRDIAMRTLWLARQASEADMRILAELSRKCAIHAASEGLRLSEAALPHSKTEA